MPSDQTGDMDFFLAAEKVLFISGGKADMTMQRQWLIAGLMLMTASVAQAQQANASRAAIIASALDIDVATAQTLPALDKSHLQVYVGSRPDAPFLRDIIFHLNGGEAVRYEFSDKEALALQRGALHRIVLPGVKDGGNQLIVEFHSIDPADKGVAIPKRGQFTRNIDGAALRILLGKAGLMSDSSFDISNLEPASGLIAAQIGEADFMMADEEYFAAASLLTGLSSSAAATQFSEDINKRLSICRSALGLQAPATAQANNNGLVGPFNQALLQVQQDHGAEATAALDAIGRSETTDSAALTLRDQANLVLAYYYLNHSQGAAAIPVFERIRSPGPFANAGLLGLGWALLQPPHREGAAGSTAISPSARYPTIVTPRLTADIAALKQEQAPRVPVADKEQQNALRRALVPWTELIGRDPSDPAVQEGMLAIAWTLYHFGAYSQAQDSYMRAADQLNKMRGWYEQAIGNVRSGGMVAIIASRDGMNDSGWSYSNATLPPARAHWWHGDTPEVPKAVADNFYLERLLLDDSFSDALDDYRTLLRIDISLRDDETQLMAMDSGSTALGQISTLKPVLAAEMAQQRSKLEGIAISQLQEQKKQLEKYLIEARFALATIYDRPELVSAQ